MSSKLPELLFKQTGQNITVIFNSGESTKTIVIKDKEERESFKEKLKSYIAKKNPKLLKEIEAILTPKTVKEKAEKEKKIEAAVADVKLAKHKAKGEAKTAKAKTSLISEITERLKTGEVTQDEVNALEALISKAKKVAAPVTTVAPTKRRGEY